jgi:tetratricopeptide (TPR) repeat protein
MHARCKQFPFRKFVRDWRTMSGMRLPCLLTLLGALCCAIPARSQSGPSKGLVNPGREGTLPPESTALARSAAEAFAKRDWDSARSAYAELLQAEPVNALAWANLGVVEQQAGNMDASIEAFEQSVRFNPALVQSWIALGLAYSERGDRYKAVSALSRAVHEDPMDARAHNYLAIVGNKLGWTQMAQAEFEKAVQLNPDYGIAHFNLSLTYLEQRPPALELARRHYEKAVSLGLAKDEIVERRLKEGDGGAEGAQSP